MESYEVLGKLCEFWKESVLYRDLGKLAGLSIQQRIRTGGMGPI